MKNYFSVIEVNYINSEQNQLENQKEINELNKILNEIRPELAKRHKTKLENIIVIGKCVPTPETIGIFPFEHQWYLYKQEDRYSELEIYGPYSTREAVLISIQTAYTLEDYKIKYNEVSESKNFRK